MSQFGYGKRTCQGQAVTEADLLVGIGSVAWLFNISKTGTMPLQREFGLPPTPESPLSEVFDSMHDAADLDLQHEANRRSVNLNEKLSRALLAAEGADSELTTSITSIFPASATDYLGGACAATQEHNGIKDEQLRREEDPTLVYSTLLIAKPLPFKFDLHIRNRTRAEKVMGQFVAMRIEGEFTPSREYWGPNQGAGQELGWGKV